MSNQQRKIMFESDEAARQVQATVWQDSKGKLHLSEYYARYDGCTHKRCECGAEYPKGRSCRACDDDQRMKRYLALEFKEWDESVPVMLENDDKIFMDLDSLYDWCEFNELNPADLQLRICEADLPGEIELDDLWSDFLPDDVSVKDASPELWAIIEQANKIIRERPPVLCWVPGEYRTSVANPEGWVLRGGEAKDNE